MRNIQSERAQQGADRPTRRRALLRFVVVAAFIARPMEAQQDTHFEVLTLPPENVGTCLPPLLRAAPGATVRPGNRLVMKSLEPGRSREISIIGDDKGQSLIYTDRASISQSLRTEAVSITAFVNPAGISGFRMGMVSTVPDSVLRMKDVAAIQRVIFDAGGTMDRRALDTAEQQRVRSMLEFLRRRCP